jgi:hypothetical protein
VRSFVEEQNTKLLADGGTHLVFCKASTIPLIVALREFELFLSLVNLRTINRPWSSFSARKKSAHVV